MKDLVTWKIVLAVSDRICQMGALEGYNLKQTNKKIAPKSPIKLCSLLKIAINVGEPARFEPIQSKVVKSAQVDILRHKLYFKRFEINQHSKVREIYIVSIGTY